MKTKRGNAVLTVVLIVLSLCSLVLSGYIVMKQLQTPLPQPKKIETVTPTIAEEASPTPLSTYTCPETEWVDCMPGPDKETKQECTEAFLTWAKTNCPDFKGAAY